MSAAFDQVPDLLARIELRDRKAFKTLYDIAAPRLVAIALRVLDDRGGAEDVVQDTFVHLWQRAVEPAAPTARNFAWMSVVVRNRAIDLLRKRAPLRPLVTRDADGEEQTIDLPDDGPALDEMVAARQDAKALQGCLRRLEAEPRQCVMLAYAEGLTHLEIAERLNRPLGTVKAWTRRSLQRLKACLDGGEA